MKFPLNIQLSIRGRIQDATGTNLDHYKTFNLTINKPILDIANREQAYDDLNANNTINTRLAAEYSDPTRTNLENEVIREILRTNGNQTEIDKIYNDPQQRDILIQRIRAIPNFIQVFTIQQLQ